MISKVKKLLAMLLVYAIIFANLGFIARAEEESLYRMNDVSVCHINPLYEGVLSESDIKKNSSNHSISSLAEPEYVSDERIIVDTIREAMVQREERVTVYYTQEGDVREGIASKWVDLALEETGNPKEGDYLRWHYGGFRADGNGWMYGNVVYYTFDFTFTYYTTAEQEAEMDAAVLETLDQLGITQNIRKYEIVETIYDYMCENITYDYENLNDDSYMLKYSAYAALINKTSVCQGYATLLYRMLREAGIEARVIAGESFGEAHSWNIVKLGNQYYYLDATWDAGQETYAYFLKGADNFNEHESWEDYTTSEFTSKYPISSTDFEEEEIMENPFDDIKDTDYYYNPVIWAVEQGITDGWTEDKFAPDMACTRGQVVTFLWRAAGEPKVKAVNNPFVDVSESAYYYEAVLWAVENGITDGWTEDKFAPDMECTRGQIVTFIWRAADTVAVEANTSRFIDVTEDAYYHEAVLWAVENGITDGWTEDKFAPDIECTRGQIVTFLYRYYN